jgi:hypothetical protein
MVTAVDRRTFLKHAGMGTIVLAGAPVLAGVGATPAMADEENGTGFFFSALDTAGGPADSLLMWGCGHFDENERHITGNGEFVHYDGTSTAIPKPIKATGLWKPRHPVSFHSIGSFGTNNAGIMVADVILFKQAPAPEEHIVATLTVVCNIPQAALSTGPGRGLPARG